jgi:glyoxylate utilization-related uncharacterized protein
MGYLEVVHPQKGITVEVPYISLHYMEHGSFSFEGTVNQGRVDLVKLHKILKDVR